MPTTDSGKAIASRNATTHGLFARDVVLPSLGEDPLGYQQLQDEWTQQLSPRNLLEQHYVEKIAAASWRLRRLHRWQAQLFEDDTLTEDERLSRLDKVLRHETALQRQIDTAVKMLHKDAPQLYQRRLRDQVLEDLHITERECRDEPETDLGVSLETSNRLYQLRKSTHQAVHELSEAPIDTVPPGFDKNCENEPGEAENRDSADSDTGNCENELGAANDDPVGSQFTRQMQRRLRQAPAPVPHKRIQNAFKAFARKKPRYSPSPAFQGRVTTTRLLNLTEIFPAQLGV